MKGATVLVATAGLLVVNSEATRLVQRDRAPAVVGFGIQRKAVSNPVKRDQLRQRRSTKTVLETLDNEVR